ncbi:MAG: SurA N-terminal domain-containing protein [Acidobacteriota bacterium]|nr:MAG: SurA N-terminal domain-containing protein [Acidobacteriota bacterium]
MFQRLIGLAAVFLLAAACAGCAGEGPVKKTEPEAQAPAPEKLAEADKPATSRDEPAGSDKPATSRGEPAEAVARVNGVEISRDELEARLARIVENRELRAQRKLRPEEVEEYRHRTLDMLIANELLYQEAVRHGYEATPEEIEKQLQLEKMKFAEEVHFLKALKHQGITMDAFMGDMKRMVMISKFLEAHVFKDKINLREEDARAAYDATLEKFKAQNPDREPPSYSAMRPQIFLRMEEDLRDRLKSEFLYELSQRSTIDVYE